MRERKGEKYVTRWCLGCIVWNETTWFFPLESSAGSSTGIPKILYLGVSERARYKIWNIGLLQPGVKAHI